MKKNKIIIAVFVIFVLGIFMGYEINAFTQSKNDYGHYWREGTTSGYVMSVENYSGYYHSYNVTMKNGSEQFVIKIDNSAEESAFNDLENIDFLIGRNMQFTWKEYVVTITLPFAESLGTFESTPYGKIILYYHYI